jgi:tetratricopeptide (TPR) repeat protein
MSEQEHRSDGSLVPAGRRDLASIVGTNPLVSRGLADLALGYSLAVSGAISPVPQDASFYYNRGITRWEEYEWEEAINDFDEAIRLDPQNALYYNARGLAWLCRDPRTTLYARSDDWLDTEAYNKAFRDFDNAIRLDPQNALLYNTRGIAWLHKTDDNYDSLPKRLVPLQSRRRSGSKTRPLRGRLLLLRGHQRLLRGHQGL